MKKLITSIGIVGIVATIAVGATIAYFNDVETSSGNTITAGSLNLQLECPGTETTESASLNPNYGYDTTQKEPKGYTLNTEDLAKLATSDNSRYDSKDKWEKKSYSDDEYIDFAFPDLPSGATRVNSVVLKFEWQREKEINAARLQFTTDGGSNWQTHDLSLPHENTDDLVTLNLKDYGIDTVAEVNNLIIRFQATHNPAGAKTKHNWVQVNVDYTTGSPATWCENSLTGQFNVAGIKPNDVGVPATVKYKNNGSVGGKLKVGVSGIVDNENIRYSPESAAGDTTEGTGEMSQYLHLWVNGIDVGKLANLAATPYDTGITVAPGAEGTLTINWSLPDDASINQVQSDSSLFNIDFILKQ